MIEFVDAAVVFAVGVVVGTIMGSSRSESSPDSVQAHLEERREEIRAEYESGRISHERFAAEVELVEDPATEDVMYAAVDVDGVGPATAFELAREYRRPEALADAHEEDLRTVNGIGENRARAIHRRVAGGRSV